MTYEAQQQGLLHNPQFNPQGIGHPIGAFGQGAGWGMQPAFWGQQQPWWGQQQRQLSQQDVSEVVRHLLPALPQILAQAQQPQAIGYAAYGPTQRQLTPQDVQEVVRQLLPVVPQIVASLQGQPQFQHIGMHGGFGQYGWPQLQSAFGVQPTWGQWPQRHLSQQDVAEISRQLVGLIPQVISNLQAFQQPRMI
jgi:hypothetical protein